MEKAAEDLFPPKFDGVLKDGLFGEPTVSSPDVGVGYSTGDPASDRWQGPHRTPVIPPTQRYHGCSDVEERYIDRSRAVPLQPMQVYIPPADDKLIAEISRLHAVIGRYREAWQVTVADLDEIVTGASDALTADDLSDFEQRFLDVTRYYEGGGK